MHRGRQLCKDDFKKFDYIFGMDKENFRNIKSLAPADNRAVLGLLGEYDKQGGKIIDDPYYGGEADFEEVYQKCLRCCQEFYRQASRDN
ncbi:low molecular weight phosphotyrosine protein phosphatase-like [Watersipora subatra]|uniref:low molecular weight phosphotyrosine protein phosphatase-like n=1 Tax=Watersipora subatra TaxID=2589382 RepID=UPI00355B3D95